MPLSLNYLPGLCLISGVHSITHFPRLGAIRGPSVQTKLEALEARQGEVATKLAGLLDEPVRLPPNLAALYRRKVAALQNLLEDEAARTEAVEIIRSLVDQVIFRPSANAGLEIELVGDIARMVHLANFSMNTSISGGVHDEFASSVKMVAGGRSQRYLPMLASSIPTSNV